MKLQELNHSLTPEALQDLNAKIVALFDQEHPSDYGELRALLSERDRIINTHLTSLQNDENKKRLFAQKELVVNHSLKHAAQSLLDSSKEEIIQFVRGKAAVKKYK